MILEKYIANNKKVLVLLVGHPLSGKSTFLKQNNIPNDVIISRDNIILDMANTHNYNDAWNVVDQKEVDTRLRNVINELSQSSTTSLVVIDMTNLTVKGRKRILNKFGNDFYKIAIIFPILSLDEIIDRNNKRMLQENKHIPIEVIKNMKNIYEIPTLNENLNEIINI